MTIHFACAGCSQPYAVADDAAGKKTKCKKCGAALTVPSPAAPIAPLGGDDLSDLLSEAAGMESFASAGDPLQPSGGKWTAPKPQPPALNLPPVLLAAIGVGVLVLLLFIGGLALLMFSGSSRTQTIAGTGRTTTSAMPAASGGRIPRGGNTSDPTKQPDAVVSSGGGQIRPQSPPGSSGSSSVAGPADDTPAPSVPWTATADPPANAPEHFELKAGFSYPVNSSVDVVMPQTPSPFMLLVSDVSRREGLLSVDLRTGEPAAQVGGKFKLREPLAFRADGRFVAGADTLRKIITVVSLPDGAPREIQPAENRRIEYLQWTGDGKLLTMQDDLGEPILTLWDIESGKNSSLRVPKDGSSRFIRDSVAVSPAGRFAALLMGSRLCVYNLATGKCVGTAELPVQRNSSILGCDGICFSPDGSQLAALVRVSNDYLLTCWNFATGQVVLERTFGESPYQAVSAASRYEGPGLTWLPGGGAWLLKGHVLLDGKSGMPVWTLPAHSEHARMALSPTRYVMCVGREGSANVFAQHEVAKDKLAEAIQLVRSGGRPSDVGLPALARFDLAAVKEIKPPAATKWAVEPDAAVQERKALTKPLRINGDDGLPRTATFARDADRVLMLWNRAARAGASASPSVVRGYSVGGTSRGEVELPAAASLQAVSPSGKYFITGYPGSNSNPTRLDLWSIAEEKHRGAWRPYADSSEARYEQVTWAEFIDDEHVLTGNLAEQTVLWKLPECQPVYVANGFRPAAISPGGKYVALWSKADERMLVIDALTGECRGSLEGGDRKYSPAAAVFSANGQALAAAGSGLLQVWDLQKGELTQEISLSSIAALPLRWLDDRYLLAANRYLIDRTNRAVVWEYESRGNTAASGSGDARFWFVSTDPNNELPGFYLGALPVPSDAVKAKTAGIKQEDLLILGPGGKASLSVSAGVPGVDASSITQALTHMLEDNGVTIDNAAPVRVAFSGSQSNTGEVQKYETMTGAKREVIEVPVQLITASLTISDNKGRRWETKQEFRTRGGFIERGDVQQNLADQLRNQFEGFARGVRIPKYVYPQQEGNKPEGSRLTLRGELPASPN